MVKLVAKLAVLVLLSCAFFVAYSLSAPYVQSLLGSANRMSSPSITTAALQGVCLALFWGIAFAFPLAWLWGRFAFLAAFVCIAPVILVTLVAYSQRARPDSTFLAMSSFIASLAVIVPSLALAAHFIIRRTASLRGSAGTAGLLSNS